VYTWEEVKKHNKLNDLWVVLNGKIYDITPFVDEHPGGESVLKDVAGKDATTAFSEEHDHSQSALVERDKYYIGNIQ